MDWKILYFQPIWLQILRRQCCLKWCSKQNNEYPISSWGQSWWFVYFLRPLDRQFVLIIYSPSFALLAFAQLNQTRSRSSLSLHYRWGSRGNSHFEEVDFGQSFLCSTCNCKTQSDKIFIIIFTFVDIIVAIIMFCLYSRTLG